SMDLRSLLSQNAMPKTVDVILQSNIASWNTGKPKSQCIVIPVGAALTLRKPQIYCLTDLPMHSHTKLFGHAAISSSVHTLRLLRSFEDAYNYEQSNAEHTKSSDEINCYDFRRLMAYEEK